MPAPESVSPNQPREELSSNLQPAEHTVLVLKMEVDLAARNHLSHPTELCTKADIILKVIRSGQFDSIVVNFFFFLVECEYSKSQKLMFRVAIIWR